MTIGSVISSNRRELQSGIVHCQTVFGVFIRIPVYSPETKIFEVLLYLNMDCNFGGFRFFTEECSCSFLGHIEHAIFLNVLHPIRTRAFLRFTRAAGEKTESATATAQRGWLPGGAE